MSNFDKTVSFCFEGKTITTTAGKTLAAAIHDEGVHVLSRSVKYHRPRGYTCGFGACGNCPLTVNGQPGVVSCLHEVEGGEDVRRELGFPSTSFDVLRLGDILRRWLPAGFQFHLFPRQPLLSRISGRALAHLAGGGRYPTHSASTTARVAKVHRVNTDVLVVGGGVSGLLAALVAAEAGRAVVIVDPARRGGRALVKTEPMASDGANVSRRSLIDDLLVQISLNDAITSIKGFAFGFLDNIVPIDAGHERWEVTPEHVILATGSYETAPLFVNNDRPGVMYADAALKLRAEIRSHLGRRIVVATDSDRGHDVANRLAELGENVVAILDSRQDPPSSALPVKGGATVLKAAGWSRVRSVQFTIGGKNSRIQTDILCLAFKRRPADELILHTQYAAASDEQFPAVGARAMTRAKISIVGSAADSPNHLPAATAARLSGIRPLGGELATRGEQ